MTTASEPKYYLYEDNQVTGPFSTTSLHERMRNDEISLDTQCCLEGTKEWISVSKVIGENAFQSAEAAAEITDPIRQHSDDAPITAPAEPSTIGMEVDHAVRMGMLVRAGIAVWTALLVISFIACFLSGEGKTPWTGLVFVGVCGLVFFISTMINLHAKRSWIIEDSLKPDEKMLFNMVRKAAELSGQPLPKIALDPDRSPNAYTFGLSRRAARIVVHAGLIDMFNRQEIDEREFIAILAHEFGHVVNGDGAIKLFLIFPIWFLEKLHNIAAFLGDVAFRSAVESRDGEAGLAMYVVALMAKIVCFFIRLVCGAVFFTINMFSRAKEYAADRFAGAVMNNPAFLQTALIKLELSAKRLAQERAVSERYDADELRIDYARNWLGVWSSIRAGELGMDHPLTRNRVYYLDKPGELYGTLRTFLNWWLEILSRFAPPGASSEIECPWTVPLIGGAVFGVIAVWLQSKSADWGNLASVLVYLGCPIVVAIFYAYWSHRRRYSPSDTMLLYIKVAFFYSSVVMILTAITSRPDEILLFVFNFIALLVIMTVSLIVWSLFLGRGGREQS